MLFVAISAITFQACQQSEEVEESKILITDDLSFLYDVVEKPTGNLNKSLTNTYPWTGCKKYKVKLNVFLIGEIETEINHCCVKGVCASSEMWNLLDLVLGENLLNKQSKIKKITVINSSSWSVDKYTISIAEGDYTIDKEGRVNNLKFKVIIN